MRLNQLAKELHETAREHGWWEGQRNFGEILALIHSEVSEALEEWRNGKLFSDVYEENGKPAGIPIEMADILIRVLDACAGYEMDIDEAMRVKMEYNRTRPYRHGGKLA